MRLLPLACVFALAACDATVADDTRTTSAAPPPASIRAAPPSTLHFFFWGPSNAAILANEGDDALNATFAPRTGFLAEADDVATWGGVRLMPDSDPSDMPGECGDFSSRYGDECYGDAVRRTRELLNSYTDSATDAVGGVVWHNGTDQDAIGREFTQAEYDAEFRLLIRSVARDLPGVPFYVVQAGTSYAWEIFGGWIVTAVFRAHEAAICEEEPNCELISTETWELVHEACQTCGFDAGCVHKYYFERLEFHWQPRSVERIMAEAGRNLARFYSPS